MSALHQKQINIKRSTYKKLHMMINLNKLYSFREPEVVLILFNYSVEQVILPFLVNCAVLMISLMSISATSIVFWPLCSCLQAGQWQLNRSHTLWNLFKERSYRTSYLKIFFYKSNYVEQFIFPNMVLCSVMAAILQMVYMIQIFQRRISTKAYNISSWGQCPVVVFVVVLEFRLITKPHTWDWELCGCFCVPYLKLCSVMPSSMMTVFVRLLYSYFVFLLITLEWQRYPDVAFTHRIQECS